MVVVELSDGDLYLDHVVIKLALLLLEKELGKTLLFLFFYQNVLALKQLMLHLFQDANTEILILGVLCHLGKLQKVVNLIFLLDD